MTHASIARSPDVEPGPPLVLVSCPGCERERYIIRHSGDPGPCRHCAGKRSAQLRWERTLAGERYYDWAAVARLVSGHPVTASPADRVEAVRILTARGMSARRIAEHLRVTERTVTRCRALLRAQADYQSQKDVA